MSRMMLSRRASVKATIVIFTPASVRKIANPKFGHGVLSHENRQRTKGYTVDDLNHEKGETAPADAMYEGEAYGEFLASTLSPIQFHGLAEEVGDLIRERDDLALMAAGDAIDDMTAEGEDVSAMLAQMIEQHDADAHAADRAYFTGQPFADLGSDRDDTCNVCGSDGSFCVACNPSPDDPTGLDADDADDERFQDDDADDMSPGFADALIAAIGPDSASPYGGSVSLESYLAVTQDDPRLRPSLADLKAEAMLPVAVEAPVRKPRHRRVNAALARRKALRMAVSAKGGTL